MERRRRKSNGFKWVMVLLVLAGIAIIGRQEYNIYQIKQQQQAVQQRIDALQKQQSDLKAERKRLDDPRYIEKLAREDYNMVGKDEVPLFIVDEKEKQKQDKTEKEQKK